MTDRSKIIEVMARAMCAKAHLPADDIMSDGKPFWSVYAGMLEYALQAEGMAVVPGWQPIESAPAYEPVLIMTVASDVWIAFKTPRRSSRTPDAWQGKGSSKKLQPVLWMPLPAASPYGKAVVKEKDDE